MTGNFPTKVEAFFKEFPFLYRYKDPRKFKNVLVQRWDKELLGSYSMYSTHPDAPLIINLKFLLDDAQDLVGIVGEMEKSWWNPLTWSPSDPRICPSETLFDKVQKIGDAASRVTLVVVCEYTLDEMGKITLYKPAHGYTNLREWVDAVVAQDREELHN